MRDYPNRGFQVSNGRPRYRFDEQMGVQRVRRRVECDQNFKGDEGREEREASSNKDGEYERSENR